MCWRAAAASWWPWEAREAAWPWEAREAASVIWETWERTLRRVPKSSEEGL